VLTGQIRSQIDSIWNDFWFGGVSNPPSVIEQITKFCTMYREGRPLDA
jgi:type I restriction enzyme M protein